MKILMHVCCGPCSLYPFKSLTIQGHEVTGYFFNPNIHPFVEFEKRVEALKSVSILKKMPVIWDETTYDLKMWLKRLEGEFEFGPRCKKCYFIRLQKTASIARKMNFDAFTTSLLYSKYQFHNEIEKIGNEVGNIHNIEFYYEDFRQGWHQGIEESLRLGIYRQNYCGCIFSEAERFEKRIKRLRKKFADMNEADAKGGDY